MKKEKFLELFQEILELEDQEMKMEDIFRDYEEWDSLAVLSLIAMINEEYEIIIPRKEFDEMLIVEDVYNYVVNK